MASNAFAVDPREKRIAVLVDREGLGDALLKIPFLRATRRAFPGHRVWWIATHQTAMEDDLAPWVAPLIDRVIANAGLTSPGREIVPRLRRLPPFDVVFDARSRFMTVLLARRYLKHRGFYACLPGFMLSDRLPPGRFTRPDGHRRAHAHNGRSGDRPRGRLERDVRRLAGSAGTGGATLAGRAALRRAGAGQPRGAQELAARPLHGAGARRSRPRAMRRRS